MGVIVEEQEITGSVSAKRFFKVFISNDIRPKALPQVFKSCEFVEGNGGPGSIQHFTYIGEGGVVKSVKFRFEEVDEKNLVFKYTIIEDEHIGQHFESVICATKFEDGPNGGFILKITYTYHTKGDDHNRIKDIINEAKQGLAGFIHVADAYLNSHPHEYN